MKEENEMSIVTGRRLNSFYKKLVSKVLGTREELEANTKAGYIADALVTKEINDSLGTSCNLFLLKKMAQERMINPLPGHFCEDVWIPAGVLRCHQFYKSLGTCLLALFCDRSISGICPSS